MSVCPPGPVDRCGQTGRRVLCRVEVSQEHGRGAAASLLAPAGLVDCLCAPVPRLQCVPACSE